MKLIKLNYNLLVFYLQIAHDERFIGKGAEAFLYGIWHTEQLNKGLPSSELKYIRMEKVACYNLK